MFSVYSMKNSAIICVLALFVAACASVTPQSNITSQAANAATDSQASAPVSQTAAGNVDTTQDTWAKQHAAYLRTLDFAKIDRQKNIPATYSIKTEIINSRYYIRNSETDLTVDHNVRSALRELRSAKQLFDRAIANASSKEVHLLDKSKSMLDALIKQTELSMQNKCDSPDHQDYHLLEGKLETLLAAL